MFLKKNQHLWLSAAVAAACVACGPASQPAARTYAVRVRCQTLDGQPVPGVLLSGPGGAAPVQSDADGVALLRVMGHEGEDAPLHVLRVPSEYLLDNGNADAAESHRVVLKQLLSSSGAAPLALSHELRLRRRHENYVILLSIDGAAGRAVAANGAIRAWLNSRGAAAFRYPGSPGEELQVSILQDHKRPGPHDLHHAFTLPDSGSILSYRLQGERGGVNQTRRGRQHRSHKPHHHHKHDGVTPVQIPFSS